MIFVYDHLTLAGGHVNGFSPRLRVTTVVMKRSSTGNDAIRLPLKSSVVSCRYEISAIINISVLARFQCKILYAPIGISCKWFRLKLSILSAVKSPICTGK